jgi:hypothetical protein
MDGICPAFTSNINDLIAAQVGIARRRGSEQIRLICESNMHGLTVGFREDSYRLDTKFPASALDTDGDLASVGDQ